MDVRILGTSADAIDEAEDRERFDALLRFAAGDGDGVLELPNETASAVTGR